MTRGTHRLSLALLLGSVAAVGMAQPQLAPPPRPVPTTTAGLLVGQWKLVKHSLPVEIGVFIFDFSAEGKCRVIIENRRGKSDESGVYELNNKQLIMILTNQNGQHKRGDVMRIEKIDRDTLVILGQEETAGQIATFSRMR